MGEVFETTDVELTEHTLSGTYGSMRLSAHGERRGMRLAHARLANAAWLDHVSFAMTFDAVAAPPGALIFGELTSGRVRHGSDRGDRYYGPGQPFLAVQPEHSYTATVEDAEAETAVIDPALPSELAETAPGPTPRPVRFTGYEPVSPQAAAQWRATYAYVRDTVLTSLDAASQPLVAASAAQLLVATALAVFPNNALTDPTAGDRHDASPPALRRAVAFIDENAYTDITVADIAAAAFITIRAVQLTFRRHMDTTPMQYLRRVRLARAHQDLIAADPGSRTVTAIACRWGFPSPSRFAAAHRRAYGVHPSHTLRAV
jgi:AraC-like DNA-binding protein